MTAFAYLIEPPFNHRNAGGTVTGCDVELARTVFGTLGGHAFEPVETEVAQLLPGLAGGRWPMTTGLFATEPRRTLAAFSRPIWALPDGLLVRRGDPLGLAGYRSVARADGGLLAVVRGQVQHDPAIALGVPEPRILVFEPTPTRPRPVLDGRAHAHASVARAHGSHVERSGSALDVVTVGADEKEPMAGYFGFNRSDDAFRRAVDDVLATYLGSGGHRAMMAGFGLTDAEVDLVAPRQP